MCSLLPHMRASNVVFLIAGLCLAPAVAGPAAHTGDQGVRIELRLNKPAYTATEPVEIMLMLSNPTSTAATFQFPTGQMFDFLVTRQGKLIWQWSYGRAFTQAFTRLTLSPGESRVFNERWDQRDVQGRYVPAGEYEMLAVFPTDVGLVPRAGADGPQVRFQIVN
ncbi:MAG: hypothetical protein E6G99_03675 [Bacillati bacterium ANGP1]|uniref:Intracellular proteinase inhibitor BsuPI domain-containing protein n=1 Tax=Candidatus Segetimicrobium genomatis TaxID=2569760 RepID=A0A537LRK6_9BACT|nr:MAG: hypothetical protein E6G99_03675 [Terrabacteria group bacterium ANGP1]TMJ10572.1 MAG: hypothetical protein E6G98_07415 [Terrabacteria group bacterium ANGP1]